MAETPSRTVVNFKESCVDPLAKLVMLEAMSFAVEKAESRLDALGKIFPGLADIGEPILQDIKDIRFAVENMNVCSIPGPAVVGTAPLPFRNRRLPRLSSSYRSESRIWSRQCRRTCRPRCSWSWHVSPGKVPKLRISSSRVNRYLPRKNKRSRSKKPKKRKPERFQLPGAPWSIKGYRTLHPELS